MLELSKEVLNNFNLGRGVYWEEIIEKAKEVKDKKKLILEVYNKDCKTGLRLFSLLVKNDLYGIKGQTSREELEELLRGFEDNIEKLIKDKNPELNSENELILDFDNIKEDNKFIKSFNQAKMDSKAHWEVRKNLAIARILKELERKYNLMDRKVKIKVGDRNYTGIIKRINTNQFYSKKMLNCDFEYAKNIDRSNIQLKQNKRTMGIKGWQIKKIKLL